MKQKILHASLRADYGGAPNYINTMINNLSKDYQVYIACPNDKPYYDKWKNNEKVKGIYLLPHRKFTLSSFFGLLNFIKKHKISLVQANGKGAGSYRFVKLFRPSLKVIYAYRGFHIDKYNYLQKQLYFLYERFMTLFTDKVINVSKGEQKLCIENKVLNKDLSVQIYNGINSLEHTNNPKIQSTYEGKFVISTLSRFDIQKNMGMMYNIAQKLKSYDDIQFIFIGDGEDKIKLEEKAKTENLNNIDFVGFKDHDDKQEYLSVSDLYLSTARWEGLPFALVEAVSMSLPIVASDVVGNNEVCLHNKNGLLFSINSVDQAVDAILKLYNDIEKRKLFGKKSREIFLNTFTVNQMITNHERLYKELINAS